MSPEHSVLITGASTGIGAVYADRFARRGHDLILVARDLARMEVVAGRLRRVTRVAVDLVRADLTNSQELAFVEARLRDDDRIRILVNNAGANVRGNFLDQSAENVAQLISLNVTAVARLASAVSPRFSRAGEGAIINIGSAVALVPEFGFSVYGATKAFVLYLSQALHAELTSKGIYVQAVLPAATKTEIWERTGIDVSTLPAVMEVEELVDAALLGFDRRESVTIPSLPKPEHWTAFEAARQIMAPTFNQVHAAARYQAQPR